MLTSVALGVAWRALPRAEETAVRVLLVRHGQSEANRDGLLSGGSDDSRLTPLGTRQATALGTALGSVLQHMALASPSVASGSGAGGAAGAAVLFGSSPMARAVATVDLVASRISAAAMVVSRIAPVLGLREMEYGELDGKPIAGAMGEMKRIAQAWRDGEVDVPVGGPTGEGPAAVAIRMRASVLDVLKFAPPGSMVVLVTHAHAIKALLADLLPGQGLSKIHAIPQANCGVNVIDVTAGGGFQVRAVNLICSDADEDAAPTAPTAPTAPAPPSGGGKL